MYDEDERNIPPLNRVGDPDDIIASVLVADSKVGTSFSQSPSHLTESTSSNYSQIQPNTYSAMPSYRICTADGVTHLTEGLAAKLKEVLEREVRDA